MSRPWHTLSPGETVASMSSAADQPVDTGPTPEGLTPAWTRLHRAIRPAHGTGRSGAACRRLAADGSQRAAIRAVRQSRLAPPVERIGRALALAEINFVEHVVVDGGIGPWRRRAEGRFLLARQAVLELKLGRIDTADLIVALLDRPLRDRCWLLMECDPDSRWSALWSHLAGNALPPYRAEPLFLLAWSAWRCGDPALAGVAARAAVVENPSHRAAGMLLDMLAAGTDPARLPPLGMGGDVPGGRCTP